MKGFNGRCVELLASALVTAALLFMALPPFGFWWLSWIAFVPLILVIYSRRALVAFLIAYLVGITAKFLIYSWLWELPGMDWPTYFLLGIYYGVFTGLWGAVMAILPRNRWLLVLAPTVWVMFDYFMANAGFLGSSWATLGQTQYPNLALIQVSSFIGEYGVSFIVMLINVALAYGIVNRSWRVPATTIAVVGLIHGYGAWELSRPESGESVRVAIVQPALAPRERGTGSGNISAFSILQGLTLEASKSQPDLIVWPESSFDQWKNDLPLISRIGDLAQSIRIPILLGTSENQKFSGSNPTPFLSDKTIYNAAFLVRANGSVTEPYHKNILMPFGEYIPMAGYFPWPDWLIPKLEPLTPGSNSRLFSINPIVSVSPVICWENTFSGYVRKMATDKPTIIAQLTNDNIFGHSAGSRQHNMSSVFRAVENRTPVVLASNTGPSQIIDRHGRIVAEVPGLFAEGWIVADIKTSSNRTFYSRFGDVFVVLILIFLALFPALTMNRSARDF